MATIQKRKTKKGISYRVMIRQSDGFPPASKTFPSLQEAKDWSKQEEARRRQGSYFPDQRARHTLGDLIDRYTTIILPTKPKNADDTLRQLTWWKARLGKYALQTISPDLIATHRQELANGITSKGTRRSPATVNRYMAALSTVMTYGVKECGWLMENPCHRVSKFQESKGRTRVATPDECDRLFEACRQSRNKHLLIIVCLAITTGMRQGEILGLTWDCINVDHGTINIKDCKNGHTRTVSLIGQPLLRGA